MNVAELINLIGFRIDWASYKTVDDATVKLINKMDNLGKRLSVTFTAPFVALAGLSVRVYAQEREAIAQVEQTIKTTNNRAKVSIKELLSEASRMQQETLVDDDEMLRNVTLRMLSFQNIAGQQFFEAQKTIADISAKLDPSMRNIAGVALQVGRALNDPVQSLGTLRRMGIVFSDDQIKVAKTLWETGQQAKAQDYILKELNKRYAGSAKLVAENSTGMIQFRNAINSLMKSFGETIFPHWKKFIDYVTNLVYKFNDKLTPGTKKVIIVFGGLLAILGPLTLAISAAGKASLLLNHMMLKLATSSAVGSGSVFLQVAKYARFLGVFLLIAGALYLIFDDIYTYLKGGESMLGKILPSWKELAPKAKEMWDNFKTAAKEAIREIWDLYNGRVEEADEHNKKLVESLNKIGVLLDPIFQSWADSLYKTFWEAWEALMYYIQRDIIKTFTTVKGWKKMLGIGKPGEQETWHKGLGSIPDTGNEWDIGFLTRPSKLYGVPNRGDAGAYTKKELTIKVNTDLYVPVGTLDYQKNTLTKTVEEVFRDQINKLSFELVQGLPAQ